MTYRLAPLAAFASCLAMAAAPASAAELPAPPSHATIETPGVFEADAVNAQQYRHYRRNRTDVGDIIGTVVAIGAIAAVAGAVSRSSRDYRTRGYPDRYPYPDDGYAYRTRPDGARYDGGSRGLEGAVDQCAREIERDRRVEAIDSASRTGNGWSVTGRVATGEAFTCSIGNDGRIDGIDYGQLGAVLDRQWSDDRYAAARAAQGGAVPASGDNRAGEWDDGDSYDPAPTPEIID